MNCELIESAANQKRGISKFYGSVRVSMHKTTCVEFLASPLTTRKLFLSSHTILYMYVRMYFVPYIAYMHTPAMWKFETADAEVRRLERASERAGRCRQSPPSPLPSRNNALSLLEPNNIRRASLDLPSLGATQPGRLLYGPLLFASLHCPHL